MRSAVASISTLLSLFFAAIACAQQISDGPYVFYKGDSTIVRSIKNDKVKTDKSSNFSFEVKPQNAPAFKVKRHPLTTQASVYPQPQTLLAISDIEGEFTRFRNILLAAHVIDEHYRWIFGNGAVVICGDLFDRGEDVTEELWLLYKLEQDAEAAGGKLHVLLGNHDVMNLTGDYRYVQPKYPLAAQLMGLSYADLYTPQTELGRWLRSKNIIEKIGSRVYLHGGVSPELEAMNLSIPEINDHFHKEVDLPRAQQSALFGAVGPFWYRGYFLAPKLSEEQLDSILQQLQATQIVVGHTIMERNIALYYHCKILALDVDVHNGKAKAALLKNNEWQLIDEERKTQTISDLDIK